MTYQNLSTQKEVDLKTEIRLVGHGSFGSLVDDFSLGIETSDGAKIFMHFSREEAQRIVNKWNERLNK